MKKGMNNYLAAIMLAVIVVAIVVIFYAVSNNNFKIFREVINKIGALLGV